MTAGTSPPKEVNTNTSVAIVLAVIGGVLVLGFVILLLVRHLRRSIPIVHGRMKWLETHLLALQPCKLSSLSIIDFEDLTVSHQQRLKIHSITEITTIQCLCLMST
jgi:hypothetical protein